MARQGITKIPRSTRKTPRTFWWVGVILLLVSVAVTNSWLGASSSNRLPPPPPIADDPLEVVCIGHVDAEFGVTSLTPSIPGKVVELLVKEGEIVKAGQPILRLDDRHATLRLDEARTAERLAVEVAAQAHHLTTLAPFKTEQLTAAVEAARAKLAAAKSQLEHRKQLRSLNSLSQSELDLSEQLVKEAEQLVIVESSRLAEWNESDVRAKARLADMEMAAVRVKVRAAEIALADCSLLAPQSGKVLRLQVSVGDMCAPTSPLAAVLFQPAGRLIVRAEIEQEYLSRVRAGMLATIQDDAKAHSHRWKGQVDRLADWISRRRSIVFEPGEMNDVRTLECIVYIEPDDVPLRVGQRVRVMLSHDIPTP